MGLMGTLAKVALGYAAARGVDHLSRNQGLGGMLGGAQVPSGAAKARQNPTTEALGQMPGMEQMRGMMAQMRESGAQSMTQAQDMFAKMVGAGGGAGMNLQEMMGNMMGGGQSADAKGSGLLSGAGGAGLAGLLSMAGGAAAAQGKGVGAMLDQVSDTPGAPEAEAAAGLMLRAMIQAAKSDGGIDAAEKKKILETVGEDADAESLAFVKKQLSAEVDPEALARDTPDAQKMQVYSMSLMPIRVDTEAEAQYLDTLASELGLDQQTVNMLHLQMGVQPLYA
ncbi:MULTISPECIES: tellurite resistance TerB family protein [Marinovum]|uniref:tellurite resistance TerB family protein n=1 Tax=Marinovum TaxID=367771 RepID=UPI00237BF19C|nr:MULTISPECIES: tellurite resistance TerB family protein [Marinovum]MDD9739029.1 tellurite resistance TerB family protein [Marinovum sp. SP66]